MENVTEVKAKELSPRDALKERYTDNIKIVKTYWHPDIELKYGASIKTMPSGCGAMIFHSYAYMTDEEIKEFINLASVFYKEDGVGAIITTLGDNYERFFNTLIECGFVEVSKYSNFRHSSTGNYKQSLLIKTL